ncbi:hypothetical protein NE237_017036 [Protea cynaroides]|uniref:Uncharacterized protein n=1 Tax=Protea cynaroides TaxID=273540 RepID=A0A9Q0QMC5_9MAGN|nr:hypothetical protein NE237_017036 [Protea cynaroides]
MFLIFQAFVKSILFFLTNIKTSQDMFVLRTMKEISSVRSKQGNIYTSSDLSPSQPEIDKDTSLKNYGSSLHAISFGFVATAILISLFLIMAIFEHLLRPKPPFSSSQDVAEGSSGSGPLQDTMHILEKLGTSQSISTSFSSDFAILMPGQQCPTFIAQPYPLSCPREGIQWPPHDQEQIGFGLMGWVAIPQVRDVQGARDWNIGGGEVATVAALQAEHMAFPFNELNRSLRFAGGQIADLANRFSIVVGEKVLVQVTSKTNTLAFLEELHLWIPELPNLYLNMSQYLMEGVSSSFKRNFNVITEKVAICLE